VIRDTYGHPFYNLVAEDQEKGEGLGIRGLLPLVHIKSIFFGNTLVSMPFLNYGGMLADDENTEMLLLEEAIRLGRYLRAKNIELRQTHPISWANGQGVVAAGETKISAPMTHKVRMLLDLPESSAKLFESFKSKLRSQIRKPQKEGLVAFIGGIELLDDYYHVFSINMRDLGSPVHSRKLFENILKEFSNSVRLGIIKHNENPTAAGLIFCFRDLAEIIWASSIRKYNHLSPNMLLYWSLLEHLTDAGYRYFDFGRSTPDEGTYKFKEQWGAKPTPLQWYNISPNGTPADQGKYIVGGKLRQRGEMIWQKLPLALANVLGPIIRGRISL